MALENEHIDQDRIGVDDLSERERTHIAACTRCRMDRERVRTFMRTGSILDSPSGEQAPLCLGNYRIEAELGRGGMGIVYRGVHLEAGHRVAIKEVHVVGLSDQRLLEALRMRLIQEGRAQALVKHPNIVAVTDVIRRPDGAPLLVMEFIDGRTLATIIEEGALTLGALDQLAEGLLSGLAAAHRQGWIHRDLKPANVLCQEIDGRIVPKISDFGLAKLLDDPDGQGTLIGAAMGTPVYMSPEQWLNARDVDHRTDLWALGAILYEMACRHLAFPHRGDNKELRGRIDKGLYPSLRTERADLPERMYRAVEAALMPDLDTRVYDCDALYELWFDRKSPLGAARLRTGEVAPPRDAVPHRALRPSFDPEAVPTSRFSGPPLPDSLVATALLPIAQLDVHALSALTQYLTQRIPEPARIAELGKALGVAGLAFGPPDVMWDEILRVAGEESVEALTTRLQ